MIIKTESFRKACNTISLAIDGGSVEALLGDTLQLYVKDKCLFLECTNREYYVSTRFSLGEEVGEFIATVNAKVFLSLIAKSTTETVGLECEGNNLVVRTNGIYKIPLIYVNETLLELPKIPVENKSVSLEVSADILNSILTYNSKEIQAKAALLKPVQRLYYIDEQGAITFTSGACVNSFTLSEPIRMLLSAKVVKLFRLFTGGNVLVELGHDVDASGRTTTKVSFSDNVTCLSCLLASSDAEYDAVPVKAIRELSNRAYEHSVVFNTAELIDALTRQLLFTADGDFYGDLVFDASGVLISTKGNSERVAYHSDSNIGDGYSMALELNSFRTVLSSCKEEYATFSFGDGRSCVLSFAHIHSVIPEAKSRK